MTRIHIIGSGPRTGTTLFAEVMNTCFEIDYFCEHEESLFTKVPQQANIFLTKKPGEFLSVNWPLKFDKNLYVICIIRDPRDSIVSEHGAALGQYWSSLRFWKKFIVEYKKLKKRKRITFIRYEDFVENPDKVQKEISEKHKFLITKYQFSNYHYYVKPSKKSQQAMRKVRQIDASGVGNWKKHTSRLADQINIFGSIAESLIKFGYESNSNWEKELKNFDNKRTKSISGDKYLATKLLKKRMIGLFYSVQYLFTKLGFSENCISNIVLNRRKKDKQ